MNIVDKLIAIFVDKVLKDMEKLADEIQVDYDASVFEKAKQDLHNKSIHKKIYSKQTLLVMLRIF